MYESPKSSELIQNIHDPCKFKQAQYMVPLAKLVSQDNFSAKWNIELEVYQMGGVIGHDREAHTY